MKKKFTIFGHSGFLGKNIVDFLEKNNLRYFLPKRDKYVFKKNLNNIIYCIGTDDIYKNPIETINSNLYRLSQVLEKNTFKSFLFTSTTRVYLGSKKTGETNDLIVNPNHKTYAFNLLKIASENLCLSKDNKNIKVVRLSNLYGNHFKNQIYLLPTLLKESKKKGKISININKNSKKNYVNVDDVIPLIFKIINKSRHRIYNIASNKSYSLDFIAKHIKKRSKCRVVYKNQQIKYHEPKIDINRVKKEFKFIPKDHFKDFLLKK